MIVYSEVLRLVRLSMILQLVVNGGMIISLLRWPGRPTIQVVGLILALTIPSLAVLLASIRMPNPQRRGLRWLLIGMVIATMLEAIGASAVRLIVTDDLPPFFIPVQTLLMFLFVPVLLGGWLDGRKGTFPWSALAVGSMIVAVGISATIDTIGQRLPIEPLAIQTVMMLITCYVVGALADQQRAEHAELQIANQRLTEQALVREQLAASHERLRVARDLHDLLAHTMAAVLMQLRAIQSLIPNNPEAAKQELAIAEQAARNGLVETRNAIANLRSTQIQDLGVADALRQLSQQFEHQNGIEVQFDSWGDSSRLHNQPAETLFLIAQEALRNIERHAGASHVWVSLRAEREPRREYILSIRDDGIGFDPAAIGSGHYGIQGIHERANLIGARIEIESQQHGPRRGTTITATYTVPATSATPNTP
ncbi:MAG: hypothetical protein Fur005_08520 [Roseiflexaceae bacterium]